MAKYHSVARKGPKEQSYVVTRSRPSIREACILIGVTLLTLMLTFALFLSSWSDRQISQHLLHQKIETSRVRIMENIGPRVGAVDGAIIASPSNGSTPNEPDYSYTWTRDSALTLSTLLPLLDDTKRSYEIESLLRSYTTLQGSLQQLDTRSGNLWSGGLAEPKFHVDGSAFDGDWGRPQRDGPALRAAALIPYAHFLLDRGYPLDKIFVTDHLYDNSVIREPGKVIKNDLEEVAHHWHEPGFDLWEEVNAHHLWTRVMSRKALELGATLATRLEDHGAAAFYFQQAKAIAASLGDFKDAESGTWRASTGNDDARGFDCALPLTIIHQGASAVNGSEALSPGSTQVLGTLREYAKSFEGLYNINNNDAWTDGILLGRYAEDVYDGVSTSSGNPWFICTFSFAHALQLALDHLYDQHEISAQDLQSPFWRDILGRQHLPLTSKFSAAEQTCKGSCFRNASDRLRKVIESYVTVAENHMGTNGRMSEQIDRITGRLRGARHLTWSYASYMGVLSATRRRD